MSGQGPAERPLSWQVCARCGKELPASSPQSQCPGCGGLLEVAYRTLSPDGSAANLREVFAARRGGSGPLNASGVWRYREVVLPDVREEDVVTYPEGNTPLL